MISLLATALWLGAQAPEPPAQPIAVTQSGVRVECQSGTKVGDREIITPFGRMLVATDPVADIVDGTQQRLDLTHLHVQGLIDDETFLQDLSTAGQLTALMDACSKIMTEQPQQLYPYETVEAWGKRLDTVPKNLKYEKRVPWLWDQIQEATATDALLLGARLFEEVSVSEHPQFTRQVSIASLRKGMRSRVPARRRVAAMIAGRQQEFSMREILLHASLREEAEAARDGAAAGIHAIHPHAARQYWVRNAANGQEKDRELAVRNLGRFGGDKAVRALMHIIAAWDVRPPQRFEFYGRTIWVMKQVDRGAIEAVSFDPVRQDADVRHLNAAEEFVDLGSTLKVGVYSESLQTALLDSLQTLVSDSEVRTKDEWLAWYGETWLPEHP